MSRLTRVSTKKSSFIPTQGKFSPPPVLQPKAEKQPDAKLPEWKPGGGGATNPVQRLLNRHAVQAKLTIGQPNDRYELEADRVARDVLQRINSPVSETPQPETVQRATEPEAEKLQMKPMLQRVHAVGGEDATPEIESSINRARGGGQPLAPGLQRSMGQPGDKYQQEADSVAEQVLQMSQIKSIERERISLKPLVQQNVTTRQIQCWGLPTDWLDYIGLGIDVVERAYIELAYEEGDEKDLRRFENTLFFAIDLILAALPAVGGGGLAMRGSRQLAIAGWGAIPDSAKLQIAEQVAKQMGWSVAKATQMINLYMKGGKGAGGTGSGKPPRKNWQITKQNTDRVVSHKKFGTFHRHKSSGLWWSKDTAGHGGSVWKVFKETPKGLEWVADADRYGDFIVGKHKGEIGKFIPWSQLN